MARRYSEEFKREAVNLYRESGGGYRKLAEELGVSAYALRQWVDRAQRPIDPQVQSESEELKRLKRENRILREEREMLRKARWVQGVDATLAEIACGGGFRMQQARRPYGLTTAQRAELWQRWKQGESLSDIARALERYPASIYAIIRKHGGIAPRSRSRSRRSLTLVEREEISRGLARGDSYRVIAAGLHRAPSSVTREVKRNGGWQRYRAGAAEQRAERSSARPKACKLALAPELRVVVAEKLQEDWSPQQISGWLKSYYPHDESMRISHESIYTSLFVQAKGVLKKELTKHLRTRRPTRKSKHASNTGQNRGMIKDLVSIRERPAEAEDRAVPGHWEGDMLSGAANSHVATLVERSTRFLLLIKLEGKDGPTVAKALTQGIQGLPEHLKRSLTWDRGPEMAAHTSFTIASDVHVYFCDPQSPWQRGSNENTNGLLRQYFPKGTDLRPYSQADLNAIADKLNTRPRKTLAYRTPAAMLQEASVATIA